MKKIDLLKRDLEDVENYCHFVRCPVCKHLIYEGWCCMECRWNGEKDDIEKYKKEYRKKQRSLN